MSARTHKAQRISILTIAKLIANFPSTSIFRLLSGCRSLRVPTSASSRCRLPFDAKHRIENVRFELECHPENSTEVCCEIQSHHWYVECTLMCASWVSSIYFCFSFNHISHADLNLSNNQINKLPDELADLTQLLRLDISHNLFLSLPHVVFKMPKLRQLKANNNAIIGEYK